MKARVQPRRLATALLLLGAAACSDRNPVAGGAPQPRTPLTARYECTAQVRARTVVCERATPDGGARASLIVGGQNIFVRLATQSVVYADSAQMLTAAITLQNLMPQPIGVAADSFSTPAGTYVFFHTGPSVTEGTGEVFVANPDTVGTFTASGQPAFHYPGVLQPYQVSPPKTWQFSVPRTVETFVFTVFLQVTMPNETGWVDVAPPHPTLLLGDTMHMTSVVRTATGAAAQDQSVSWFSADTNVVKVDSSGLITARGVGTTTVGAISGNRFGSQHVTVVASRGGGDVVPPIFTWLVIEPRAIDTNSGGTVGLTAYLRDAGTGVQTITIGGVFTSASGGQRVNLSGCTLGSGNTFDGVWNCSATIPQFAELGAWSLTQLRASDMAGNEVVLDSLDLRSAGFPRAIYVTGDVDSIAPLLTAFSFSPETVDTRSDVDSVSFALTAADSVSGVASASVFITSPAGRQIASDPCTRQSGTPSVGSYSCLIEVPRFVEDGAWQVAVELADRRGNTHVYDAAELKRLGFPSTLEVISTQDSLPPSIADFSFSPDSVDVTDSTGARVDWAGVVVDSVGAVITATVRALDSVGGVSEVSVTFTAPSGFEAEGGCVRVAGTTVDGTWSCTIELDPNAPSGVWTASVEIVDAAGNSRTYTGDELESLGFPTSLRVTRNNDIS
ncbi:MAG TPA: Ig-like domain-containing protein [Longimicrobium sp.]|nr:Ig-like domain-containing protein [Longimicrobium sp.]